MVPRREWTALIPREGSRASLEGTLSRASEMQRRKRGNFDFHFPETSRQALKETRLGVPPSRLIKEWVGGRRRRLSLNVMLSSSSLQTGYGLCPYSSDSRLLTAPKQSETDPASSLERAAKKFATLKYGRTETHFRDTNFYVLAQAENTKIRLTL